MSTLQPVRGAVLRFSSDKNPEFDCLPGQQSSHPKIILEVIGMDLFRDWMGSALLNVFTSVLAHDNKTASANVAEAPVETANALPALVDVSSANGMPLPVVKRCMPILLAATAVLEEYSLFAISSNPSKTVSDPPNSPVSKLLSSDVRNAHFAENVAVMQCVRGLLRVLNCESAHVHKDSGAAATDALLPNVDRLLDGLQLSLSSALSATFLLLRLKNPAHQQIRCDSLARSDLVAVCALVLRRMRDIAALPQISKKLLPSITLLQASVCHLICTFSCSGIPSEARIMLSSPYASSPDNRSNESQSGSEIISQLIQVANANEDNISIVLPVVYSLHHVSLLPRLPRYVQTSAALSNLRDDGRRSRRFQWDADSFDLLPFTWRHGFTVEVKRFSFPRRQC